MPWISKGRLQQRDCYLHVWTHGAQSGHQVFSGANELVDRHGRQSVDDGPQIGAERSERGPFALTPIPAAPSVRAGIDDSFPQGLDGTWGLLRIGSELPESSSPRFEISVHPGGWSERNGWRRRCGRAEPASDAAECMVFGKVPPTCFRDAG